MYDTLPDKKLYDQPQSKSNISFPFIHFSSVLFCHINIMPFCMKKCEVALLKLAAPFAPE
jgi:hypothetical protein